MARNAAHVKKTCPTTIPVLQIPGRVSLMCAALLGILRSTKGIQERLVSSVFRTCTAFLAILKSKNEPKTIPPPPNSCPPGVGQEGGLGKGRGGGWGRRGHGCVCQISKLPPPPPRCPPPFPPVPQGIMWQHGMQKKLAPRSRVVGCPAQNGIPLVDFGIDCVSIQNVTALQFP